MFENIVGNIVASVICAVLGAIFNKSYRDIKAVLKADSSEKSSLPKQRYSKKAIVKQFWCFLLTVLVALPAAISINGSASFSLLALKTGLFLISFFSFIFVWGAFEAAMDFDPRSQVGSKPADDRSGNARDD